MAVIELTAIDIVIIEVIGSMKRFLQTFMNADGDDPADDKIRLLKKSATVYRTRLSGNIPWTIKDSAGR